MQKILYGKVSAHVSLRKLRRLTWIQTFRKCIKPPFHKARHNNKLCSDKNTQHNIIVQFSPNYFYINEEDKLLQLKSKSLSFLKVNLSHF